MHTARCGPRPRGAWPACVAPVRPMASVGAVCAAHGARRRCSTSRRRRDAGAQEAAEGQRLTGAGTAAWHRRAVETAVRSTMRRSGRGAVGEAVRMAARSAGRRSGHGGVECGVVVGEQRVRGAVGARRGVRVGSCRDARRAVPTAALSRAVGVAHGGHAEAARCRAGPARCAAADKWGPLSVISELKIYPKGN
jgi:hypothetical protein